MSMPTIKKVHRSSSPILADLAHTPMNTTYDTPTMGSNAMLISEAYAYFKSDYILVEKYAESSVENFDDGYKCFIRYTGDIPVAMIDPVLVARWRDHMLLTKTLGTANLYMRKIKKMLEFLNDEGITHFRIDKLKPPRVPQGLPKFLTRDEIDQLINATYGTRMGVRDRAIIAFFFKAGLRSGELSRLNKNDVVGLTVYVHFSKNGYSRETFIEAMAYKYLNEYLDTRTDKSPILFKSLRNRRMAVNSINQMIKRYAKRAGLEKKVHTHIMRHSFATDIHEHGADIRNVQKLLGHQFISTTQIYTHVSTEHLFQVHQKCTA